MLVILQKAINKVVAEHPESKEDVEKPSEFALPAVSSANFEDQVEKSSSPVIVEAYTPGCIPCESMKPVLEKLNQERGGNYKFVKFDVSENKELASRLEIETVPTLLFYKEGRLIGRSIGASTHNDVVKKIEEFLEQ